MAMAGLSEHVIYEVPHAVTVRAGETASVELGSHAVRGDRVLVYDPKASEVCDAAGQARPVSNPS